MKNINFMHVRPVLLLLGQKTAEGRGRLKNNGKLESQAP